MVQPEPSRPVKVGIGLSPDPHNLGEWLADAAAFDAAGADALWIDLGSEPELDPLALLSALAVVTSRSLLITASADTDRSTAAYARMSATVERLSRGRLRILRDPREEEHRWLAVSPPDSRAAWRSTLADAAEAGIEGVLVPANPRLLDILRNPEEPGERQDLQLAMG